MKDSCNLALLQSVSKYSYRDKYDFTPGIVMS